MEHEVVCNFSWRPVPYDNHSKSVTGDLRITSTSGLFVQFSFDIIHLYDLEFIESLPNLEQERLAECLERFISQITIRKWVGEAYALPYTVISFPYDSDKNPATHDLVVQLILDFFKSPDVRRGLLKYSFPEREMPMDLLKSMMGEP